LLFRRRANDEGSQEVSGSAPSGATVATGKGRPTPKRKEAQQARKQRIAPPKGRREAAARERERRRNERELARQALASGDPRHLPARDRGPVRGFCRDFVDRRRSIAEFLLPLLLVVFAISAFLRLPVVSSLVLYATMLATAVDTAVLVFRLRRELRLRYPDESHKGATLYTVLRSSQLRRLRLPKPRVKVGAKV
jgi:DUF3043 family protein